MHLLRAPIYRLKGVHRKLSENLRLFIYLLPSFPEVLPYVITKNEFFSLLVHRHMFIVGNWF